MPSRVAASILTPIALLASGAVAYGQDNTPVRQDKPQAESTTANESSRVREDKARDEASPRTTQPPSASTRKRKGKARSQHALHDRSSPQSSVTPFTLVSSPPEYLSGEANVTVKGNENPVVRSASPGQGLRWLSFLRPTGSSRCTQAIPISSPSMGPLQNRTTTSLSSAQAVILRSPPLPALQSNLPPLSWLRCVREWSSPF
jgi:hypothetical protein